MNDSVKDWVDTSAYSTALGMHLSELGDEAAVIALPFAEANANPGNALHGGVAASASVTAAHALARHVLGPETGPWHTMDFQINYLAAAIGEDIQATARLLRRGKELCFMAVDVTANDGKAIANCSIAVRGRQGTDPVATPAAAGDHGEVDPGFMGERIATNPFISGRGIAMDFMRDGQVRLIMPWQESNGDLAGGVHEGAALALLDTAGAMCSWSITGLGKFKASTPSIQAQVFAPPPKGDLVAYGNVGYRDNEMYWNDIEVADSTTGCLVARGTVLYRIFS
ncbi:MAG: PaaI family thioesterase [Rhodospirillaceae bacterium]|nr:PaaI family thioesterase [Rhodospirillaceae bacterium]MBT4490813.1 PaaI family thioesterase [Rhodospirillaceae bacterium]MBT5191550.1 PaaI family thioesterase [Rhodospirillaceae bacterium]MBT5894678.1 PaaI family thioesterase [Rhodospirillaceae bacterium]MBT6428044.1 PaaI family thioesterase [Rhodospirillaceae bacterium]